MSSRCLFHPIPHTLPFRSSFTPVQCMPYLLRPLRKLCTFNRIRASTYLQYVGKKKKSFSSTAPTFGHMLLLNQVLIRYDTIRSYSFIVADLTQCVQKHDIWSKRARLEAAVRLEFRVRSGNSLGFLTPNPALPSFLPHIGATDCCWLSA